MMRCRWCSKARPGTTNALKNSAATEQLDAASEEQMYLCSANCLAEYKLLVFRQETEVCLLLQKEKIRDSRNPESFRDPDPKAIIAHNTAQHKKDVHLQKPVHLPSRRSLLVDGGGLVGRASCKFQSTVQKQLLQQKKKIQSRKKRLLPRPHPYYKLNKKFWQNSASSLRCRESGSVSGSSFCHLPPEPVTISGSISPNERPFVNGPTVFAKCSDESAGESTSQCDQAKEQLLNRNSDQIPEKRYLLRPGPIVTGRLDILPPPLRPCFDPPPPPTRGPFGDVPRSSAIPPILNSPFSVRSLLQHNQQPNRTAPPSPFPPFALFASCPVFVPVPVPIPIPISIEKQTSEQLQSSISARSPILADNSCKPVTTWPWENKDLRLWSTEKRGFSGSDAQILRIKEEPLDD